MVIWGKLNSDHLRQHLSGLTVLTLRFTSEYSSNYDCCECGIIRLHLYTTPSDRLEEAVGDLDFSRLVTVVEHGVVMLLDPRNCYFCK